MFNSAVKIFYFLINTNIFISIAAVALTVETQVQLGLELHLHPYLFIIFFATIFEYNLHRLVTVIKNPEALNDEKHKWVKNRVFGFYALVGLSVVGFVIAVLFAKKEVLITLLPIGILTLLYSLPVLKIKKMVVRLREVPLAKIFVISLVWSAATILLPIIQSDETFAVGHVILMLIERFIFVFAITVPFDIRDMAADKHSGLSTIPLLAGEKRSLNIAMTALIAFAGICMFHYPFVHQSFLLPGLLISAISTMIFIKNKKLASVNYYHYFILDGTMFLQALLVCACYFFS